MSDRAADPPALLGTDQEDNRVRLFNPFVEGERKPDLWCYPKLAEPRHPYIPTDAKRVPFEGETHVLAAYHGRVQLVRFRDHTLVRDLPSYRSCHSAEILPDGKIASANSNDGMLRLHKSDGEFVDIKLPYAHGVTWDKERECLWALGDFLYQFAYEKGELKVDKKFALPLDDPTGHDLFPLRETPKLLVSNNKALFIFDIPSSEFEPVSELNGVKSASQHVDGTLWVTYPSGAEGMGGWQTDTITRVRPEKPSKQFRNRGSKFYKARWWHRVRFSY